MCIGLPMQLLEAGEVSALCRGRNGEEPIHLLMVGAQPAGTWVLSFLGWARQVISEEDARQIDLALDGLGEIMAGAQSIDVDRYFPDINPAAEAGREA
ncbi:MAG: HypC/HybG/HupF family hydrogenase formation chaperone [Gammaproteobacteria bacterium SHHR-1]|jgi:hydrogenase expression/formation protein HypC